MTLSWAEDLLNSGWLMLTLAVFLLLALVLLAVLWAQHQRLAKRFNRILGSYGSRHNLEAIMQGYIQNVEKIEEQYEEVTQQMYTFSDLLSKCIQKVGIVRYNPFPEMGGNQSFVIALLDQDNNGVVISTIHGRDASYTYGKPIESLESAYPLSDEERQALKDACANFKKRQEAEDELTMLK